MRQIKTLAFHTVLVSLFALAVGGCASTEPVSTVTYQDTPYGTVAYPDGSYKMYGNGTTQPYYWVWVPKGSTAPVLGAPPTLPPNQPAMVVQSGTPGVSPTVVAPPPTTVASANGQYQLHGNGTTQPYYWVWVPTGVTPPAPPPLPRR